MSFKLSGFAGNLTFDNPKKKKSKPLKEYLKFNFQDLSTIILIFSNLITILIAIINNWNFLTLMWVYLFQSLIIGLFAFIKILKLKNFTTEGLKINNEPVKANSQAKKKVAFIFSLYFIFFHIIYIFFLWGFSQEISLESSVLKETSFIILSVLIFFANHLFSFVYNYKKDSKRKTNLGEMMHAPMLRILPMHLTIMFTGFIIVSTAKSNINILIFFIVLKTLADVIMHQQEHN